ncbi:uncharacterized protein [Pyxicephalus adspersus]|uniref:uncharacterized protein isoform X2 n=1 Tax=Pyxicephalus adspersus TaxID=30357 RepID=UPI003B5A3C39
MIKIWWSGFRDLQGEQQKKLTFFSSVYLAKIYMELQLCNHTFSKPEVKCFLLTENARPLLSISSKSNQTNTESTLTCMATGFFPYDIDITWYKDGEILKNQHMGKPHKNDNGTYQVNNTVTITPNDDDKNRTFSCRAQHISLQEPLQEDFQLVYQHTQSPVLIICIVLGAVVIIAVIIAVAFKLRKPCRKVTEENPANTTTDREQTTIQPKQSTEETAIRSTESPKKKDSESTKKGKKKRPQTLNQKEQKYSKTPNTASRSILQKENTNTTENRPLLDPEIGEITVPDLIAGKRAKLSCKISNYIIGKHQCLWHVKLKSTGEETLATYDGKKYPTIEKDDTTDDQNTQIAYLALLPVEQSDDGSVFIVRVYLPDSDRVIERRTGPIHVKVTEENPANTTTHRKQTTIQPNQSTEETAIQSPESPEQSLLLKKNNSESPGKKKGTQTPKQREEKVRKPPTPASRSVSQKENANTTENRPLLDPEIGEITIPDLIAGKIAKLSCKISNYIIGKHQCIWHVKVKSTGEVTLATYDGKKQPSIEKDDTSDVQNTRIAYLALLPVEQSDDGSEFIVRVYLPDSDRVIERRTGPIHVKDRSPMKLPMKMRNEQKEKSV